MVRPREQRDSRPARRRADAGVSASLHADSNSKSIQECVHTHIGLSQDVRDGLPRQFTVVSGMMTGRVKPGLDIIMAAGLANDFEAATFERPNDPVGTECGKSRRQL